MANIDPQDVSRTSHSNFPRRFPKDPIGPSRWRPGDVLKLHPEHVLIWRSRDVPGRLIVWDICRTFSGRPLEDLQSIQTWMSADSFNFSFRIYLIDQIHLKAFQNSWSNENRVTQDEVFSAKLINDFLAVN